MVLGFINFFRWRISRVRNWGQIKKYFHEGFALWAGQVGDYAFAVHAYVLEHVVASPDQFGVAVPAVHCSVSFPNVFNSLACFTLRLWA